MKVKLFVTLAAILLLVTACSPRASSEQPSPKGKSEQPTPMPDWQRASEALTTYFSLLNQGKYNEAAGYYGGSYETLAGWNPDLNPENYAQLFGRGCTINGLVCLAAHDASLVQSVENEFKFWVTFANSDGSIFSHPASGQTEFEYTVVLIDGLYRVMELPVYTE